MTAKRKRHTNSATTLKRGGFRRLTKLFYPEVGEVRIRALPMCRRVVRAAERQMPSDILLLVEMGLEPEHTAEEIDWIMESGLIGFDLEDRANRKRMMDVMTALGVPSQVADLDEDEPDVTTEGGEPGDEGDG